MCVDTHSKNQWNKCKNIFPEMLKDVGIEVPKQGQSAACMQRDDSMQQP